MNEVQTQKESVVVEREIPHLPEKVWRALTEQKLIEEWLMENDFKPVVDHRFKLYREWGAIDCQVLTVEPPKTLSYTWGAFGLDCVVTWTLTPTTTGTHLKMVQASFQLPDQKRAYNGAKAGWPRLFTALEELLTRVD